MDAIAFSPDNLTIAVSMSINYEAGEVRLYDVHSGRLRHVLRAGSVDSSNALVFASDGKTLIAGGHDWTAFTGFVRFWDLGQGRLRSSVSQADPCNSLALSPDGRLLASGGTSKKLRLWLVK